MKVPTDDARVMCVLIPAAFIEDLNTPLDQTILEVLKNTEFQENEDKDMVNIFMPCFSKDVSVDLGCFKGVKIDSTSNVEAAKLKIHLEINRGLKNIYDLRDEGAW